MESRKLISFGNSSMVISLPSSWVKKNKLKKGDEIYITDKGSELIVSRKEYEKKDLKFATISVDDKSYEIIKMEIISAYLCNYDVIEIINKKRRLHDEIKHTIHNLAGIEIIDESATKIVIKYLMDIKELSLEGIIRRIDVITRSMIEDAQKCSKEDLHKSIYQRDVNVNRLVLLAHRTIRLALENPELSKSFSLSNIDLLKCFDTLNNLEKAADQMKRMSKHMASERLSKKSKAEFDKILEKLNERYLKTMKAYYGKNKDMAYEVEVETRELVHECNKFLSKKYESEAIRVAELCKSFISHTKVISRVVIDG